MKNLNVLIDPALLLGVKSKAAKDNITISYVIRRALTDYLSGDNKKKSVESVSITSTQNAQDKLDEMKLLRSKMVFSRYRVDQIRELSLTNLARWKESGAWCSVYDEWEFIMRQPDDMVIMDAMIGLSQNSNRLRQSSPYVGMINRQELEAIREKAAS